MAMAADREEKEMMYKVLVIGDVNVGKTSIIKRYTGHEFNESYKATIGIDYGFKSVKWDENTTVRVQLWDIAGAERVGALTRVYYTKAYGALIVADITNKSSLRSIKKWKEDVNSKVLLPDGSTIPCVLVLNKHDQRAQIIDELNNDDKINNIVNQNNFHSWFFTSAKDDYNITECLNNLIQKMMDNEKVMGRHPTDQEVLTRAEIDAKRKKGCKC